MKIVGALAILLFVIALHVIAVVAVLACRGML